MNADKPSEPSEQTVGRDHKELSEQYFRRRGQEN
jgi:hypothetical protein